MDDIIEYLTAVPAWYLATCEGDQPRVRPFSFVMREGDTLWFCTATNKDVYHQLQQNPKFELSAWKPGRGWIIVTGVADLNDTAGDEVRKAGYEHMTALGETYEDWGDPRLTFFSLKEGIAKICKGVEAHTTHLHQAPAGNEPVPHLNNGTDSQKPGRGLLFI